MSNHSEYDDQADPADRARRDDREDGGRPAPDGDVPVYGTPPAEVVDLAAARGRRGEPVEGLIVDPDTGPRETGSGDELSVAEAAAEALRGDGDRGVLVDSLAAQRPGAGRGGLSGLSLAGSLSGSWAGWRDGERAAIVPSWLKSRDEFAANVGWALALVAHAGAYHCVRVPKYTAKVGFRAPRGVFRMVAGYQRWLFDLEGEPVRQAVVRAAVTRPDEAKTYDRLANHRDRRVRWRGIVTVFVAVALLAGFVTAFLLPAWVQIVAGIVLVGVCGRVGAPADKPLLDTAVVRTGVSPLTSDQVVMALSRLRVVGIDRAIAAGDTGRSWFPAPITRENGAGWRADVELPAGVPAAAVVDKREELAAALARPLGCVWPEVNAEVHPGRLVLFVADKDMSKARQKPWPLAKAGTVDLFKPFPIGTDPRGRAVVATLMFASMIIGSIPRMGKTFTLRLFLIAAALDPRAWLLVFDLKGTGDLSTLEPVAHAYRAGDEDEDIAYALAAMREMRTEMRRRTKVIRGLPRDVCPESKVTPELASKKALGLHPIVIGVDECQVWFEHPQYGAEFEEICVDLVKRGPAVGMDLILATQRPDATSIPTGVSANAVLRYCLKVMGYRENDMVLGQGMHGAGIRATMFARRDKGIGYLAGEGDEPVIARTHFIDAPAAEAIITRARAARERAGNITGHAAGHTVDTAAVRRDTLLDDLAAVLPDSDPKAWTETITDRLTALRPDLYATLTKEQLVAALKPHGVTTSQVWGTDPATGKGANRRGIDRDHITRAITRRDREKGA